MGNTGNAIHWDWGNGIKNRAAFKNEIYKNAIQPQPRTQQLVPASDPFSYFENQMIERASELIQTSVRDAVTDRSTDLVNDTLSGVDETKELSRTAVENIEQSVEKMRDNYVQNIETVIENVSNARETINKKFQDFWDEFALPFEQFGR